MAEPYWSVKMRTLPKGPPKAGEIWEDCRGILHLVIKDCASIGSDKLRTVVLDDGERDTYLSHNDYVLAGLEETGTRIGVLNVKWNTP